MPTAVEPTPPVAPVTRTGPESVATPWSWRAITDIAAVNPAVPITIASRAVSPAGSATSHSAGTRAYSANPPWRDTPMS